MSGVNVGASEGFQNLSRIADNYFDEDINEHSVCNLLCLSVFQS